MDSHSHSEVPCAKCGEPMVFIRTRAGKYMPCDPELVTLGLGPGVVLVLEDGSVLRGDAAHATEATQGYVPHWTTCPFAEDFRRRRA